MKRISRLARNKGLRRASPRRRLEIDMDQQARLACLMAAGGTCEKCWSVGIPLDWHHVITRRVRALRWLPENAVALCKPCHRWIHANPKAARAWFVERFGPERLDFLRRRLP